MNSDAVSAIARELHRVLGDNADGDSASSLVMLLPFAEENRLLEFLKTVPTSISPATLEEHLNRYRASQHSLDGL